MNRIDVLRNASSRVYNTVRDLAGTPEAGGDYGIGAGGDTSHKIDIAAEEAVIAYLKEISFGCTVLGEECGRVEVPGESNGTIIMDAVDGSVNALRGIPFYCCSLAFATGNTLGSVTDGVVTSLLDNTQYWATKGRGVYANEQQLNPKLRNGSQYRIITLNVSGMDEKTAIKLQPIMDANHTRHFGANALEMAYVARGWLDALVDMRKRIRVQDVAAGCLLVREAGGKVLDEDCHELDSDLEYSTRLSFIAGADHAIIDELVSQIKSG